MLYLPGEIKDKKPFLIQHGDRWMKGDFSTTTDDQVGKLYLQAVTRPSSSLAISLACFFYLAIEAELPPVKIYEEFKVLISVMPPQKKVMPALNQLLKSKQTGGTPSTPTVFPLPQKTNIKLSLHTRTSTFEFSDVPPLTSIKSPDLGDKSAFSVPTVGSTGRYKPVRSEPSLATRNNE
ncbi:hypothetical protein J6590_039340 [Homalodisca vitripennis]|nr:hypothetical protein J6590_039340 [Homalodisca vitripennis]